MITTFSYDSEALRLATIFKIVPENQLNLVVSKISRKNVTSLPLSLNSNQNYMSNSLKSLPLIFTTLINLNQSL